MSTVLRNFSLLDAQSTTLTATDTTQSIALGRVGDDIMLFNNSSVIIFARTGKSDVVADANAIPILAGEKGIYSRGNRVGKATHLAIFTETGTGKIIISQGLGI